jgi:hypothetical protein
LTKNNFEKGFLKMENTNKTQPNNAAPKGDDKTNANPANSAAGKTPNDVQKAQGGKAEGDAAKSGEIAAKIGDVLSGDTDAIKDVYNSAKESTGAVASQAYGFATKKATSVIDEQKASLTQGLTSVADSIRQIGENLNSANEPTGVAKAAAQYTNTAAEKVEQISGYLENKDLSGLVKDIKNFAHTNPALFLGGAFTLGILASRFLKSGGSNQSGKSSASRLTDGDSRKKLENSGSQQQKSGQGQTGGTALNTGSQNKGG